MDTTSLAHPAPLATTNLDGRDARALELYRERGEEISYLGEYLFEVPSCTGRTVYRVRYGGDVESCSCKDFEFNGGPCKHLIATALLFAARRSGVKEIRIPATIAGDPIAFGAKRKGCPACFGGHVTLTVEEDGREYEEAAPCRRCSA